MLRKHTDFVWLFLRLSSSLDEVQKHDTALLTDIAKMFNLTYSAFGKEITDPDVKSYGKLVLSDAWGAGLQPAPVTPTRRDAAPFRLLAGTIKAVHNIHRDLSGNSNGVVVSPGIMSGNTGKSV